MNTLYFERSSTFDPAENLAREEELLRTHRTGTVFFLWQNDPCVILGKNQNAQAEVDLAFAASRGIPVLARTTGGGAVYHDRGNINYTFIRDYSPDTPVSLSALSEPVLSTLIMLGLSPAFNDRNDILVDGLKVCGTAYRIDRDRILSHGCIDFSVDTDIMERVLTPSPEKLARHGIRSVRSRVLPLSQCLPGMTIETFLELLAGHCCDDLKKEIFT